MQSKTTPILINYEPPTIDLDGHMEGILTVIWRETDNNGATATRICCGPASPKIGLRINDFPDVTCHIAYLALELVNKKRVKKERK